MKRHIIFAAVMLILFTGCIRRTKAEHSAAVEVRTMVIAGSHDGISTSYIGTIKPSKESNITSRHEGRLKQVMVRQGAHVAEGQVIAIIESQSVISACNAARASLSEAEDAMKRVKRVHDANVVSDMKMVEIETKLQQAKAAAAAAEHALDECSIRAPFAGVVSDIITETGISVSPIDRIATIIDMHNAEIEFAVPESEISSFNIGDTATAEISAIGHTCQAVVITKDMVSSPLSHTFMCRLRPLVRSDRMMPGMVCHIYSNSRKQADIVIPANAIKMDSRGKYVWCVNGDNIVSKKYITLGEFVSHGVIVLDGLTIGDRIITEGMQKVCTGMKVNVQS